KSDAIKRNYSLTWPEEIVGALVFLGSFLAVRGVYALVPFLMALGCATVTTFLTLKTWRLFRSKELSFYRFNLKSVGKIRKAGWAFATFACVWIGLNAHRGAILNRLGRYGQAQASLDQALAERDDLILARQEKGESLWQLGHKDEAISVWSEAAQRNPRLALVNNELAGANQSLGKVDEAGSHERQADQFTPK